MTCLPTSRFSIRRHTPAGRVTCELCNDLQRKLRQPSVTFTCAADCRPEWALWSVNELHEIFMTGLSSRLLHWRSTWRSRSEGKDQGEWAARILYRSSAEKFRIFVASSRSFVLQTCDLRNFPRF